MLIIVTGDRGCGKTRLCQRLAAAARAAGWDVAGVLSPAHVIGGRKVAFDGVDLRRGERRQLAQRADEDAPFELGWKFDAAAMAWANEALRTAVPCDLLLVDELGPLEFEQGKGWTAGLTAIASGGYRHAVVVVRPELVKMALAAWPQAQLIDASQAHALENVLRCVGLS